MRLNDKQIQTASKTLGSPRPRGYTPLTSHAKMSSHDIWHDTSCDGIASRSLRAGTEIEEAGHARRYGNKELGDLAWCHGNEDLRDLAWCHGTENLGDLAWCHGSKDLGDLAWCHGNKVWGLSPPPSPSLCCTNQLNTATVWLLAVTRTSANPLHDSWQQQYLPITVPVHLFTTTISTNHSTVRFLTTTISANRRPRHIKRC